MYLRIKNIFINFIVSLIKIKKKLFFFIILFLVFRIGSFTPIPGINIDIISKLIKYQYNIFLEIFNIFSGGALNHVSIFTLGIFPYISASIIMQLLIFLIPSLKQISISNNSKFKIDIYTIYLTLFISIFQSSIISMILPNIYIIRIFIINPGFVFFITTVCSLVSGTMFLVWMSDVMVSYGINNGVSLIIFIGILSLLPLKVIDIIKIILQGKLSILSLFLIIFFLIFLIFLIVFIESSQRDIYINYINYNQKFFFYSYKNIYLPFRINISGIIPSIFTSTMIMCFSLIFSWFSKITNFKFFFYISFYLESYKLLYILLYIFGIFYFNFFYTNLTLNVFQISLDLKKTNAYIFNVRPGRQTEFFINNVIFNLNLISSFYIILVCLVPEFLVEYFKIPFFLSGTSLLIIVIVSINFINQFKFLILSKKHNSIISYKDIYIN